MELLRNFLLAASLCADCLAVSLCSGVSLRGGRNGRRIPGIALVFAVIQSGLLLAGWAFGHLFVGLVERISHIIGFLLLLYVGGSMLLSGIRGGAEAVDLDGWRSVVLGGVATSLDALAVGASQSMSGVSWSGILPLFVSVFVLTVLSVLAGLLGGSAAGARFGRRAELAGGVVLLAIGVRILL